MLLYRKLCDVIKQIKRTRALLGESDYVDAVQCRFMSDSKKQIAAGGDESETQLKKLFSERKIAGGNETYSEGELKNLFSKWKGNDRETGTNRRLFPGMLKLIDPLITDTKERENWRRGVYKLMHER